MAIIWALLFVVLIIIEFMTQGLTTIWFAAGALTSALLAVICAPISLQIVLFFAVSLVLLVFTRPILKKYFDSKLIDTNTEALIGKTAVVTDVINNSQNTGMVVLDGMDWTARSSSDYIVINPNEKVIVKAISGIKLIVERVSN